MALFRTCIGCGQEDDHPRHDVINVDGSVSSWHHDCHARATGNPVSKAVADTGLTGDELREHILANDPAGAYLRTLNEAVAQPVDQQNSQAPAEQASAQLGGASA